MDDRYERFGFDYQPGEIRYGRGCVADIEAELAERGAERALIVCGRTVGSTPAVIDPVEAGVGDQLVGVFDETTPDKRLRTAHDCAGRIRDEAVDALVALGGGSSLDVAKVASVLAAEPRPYDAAFETFAESGGFAVPAAETVPTLVSVPTTLAGADLSIVAGITARENERRSGVEGLVRGGVSGEALMPDALFYDPALFETTPHGVLCASAMNGFDKAIETAYSRHATPVTDATAARAVRLLSRGLQRLGDGDRDDDALYDAVVGTILAQYGCSRGDGVTLSLIHAFGHGVARGYAVQQGGAHAIVAPHALAYLFEQVDGRRHLLAAAFGEDAEALDAEAAAEAVIDGVTAVRDGLGLPTRLREIEDMPREDLPAVAESVRLDGFVPNGPEGFEPTTEGILDVLETAW